MLVRVHRVRSMTGPAGFVGPTRIDMTVVLPPSASAGEAVALLAETLRERGGPVISGWSVGVRGGPATGTVDDLLTAARAAPEPVTLTLDLDSRGLQWVLVKRRDGRPDVRRDETRSHPDCLDVACHSGVELDDADAVREALTSQSALVHAFCDRFDVREAYVNRLASRYVPWVPHAWDWRPMAVVVAGDVERDYADPSGYWRSWDTQRELRDGRVLVTRALDVLDELAYKRAVYPRIWELVHAAKPGLCRGFDVADLWTEDLAFFDEGEGFLRQLGYDEHEQSIEFTAVVPEGEHLRPREIMLWARHRADGVLPTGQPLRRVKFTFVDAAMAEREKRPLLDAGIEVWCYAPDGALVQIRS